MNGRIIAAGHICLDITPAFFDRHKSTSELLSPGKLIEVGAADVHTGGSVANTGLAIKCLGGDVELMGKVGGDAFGEMVLNILKKQNAEKGLIVSKEEATSYSIVVAPPNTDRMFLHNPGVNATFKASDIDDEALAKASLLHFGYPPLMKGMYENGGAELAALMSRAKSLNTATSLDMAAVDESSDAGLADWNEILKRVLPFVDFFLPSAEELCFMLDKPRFYDWQKRANGRDITEVLRREDILLLAERCMKYGVKVLLIKCGAKGIYYHTADKTRLIELKETLGLEPSLWASREGFERSFLPKRVLSGTGAGDTAIAAFLTAMTNGCGLAECLTFAVATGASCVESYDALSGLKSFDEINRKIAAGWKRTDAEF